jgi:RNA polymerase I-specific transcription initiation factor RRN6
MRDTKRNGADPMDDTGTYGQFGQAVYDYDERLWQFSRSPNTSHTLMPLEKPRIVIESYCSTTFTGFPKDGKEGRSRRRENQTKALIKVHPELQPASGLLLDLARVSEAVEEASDRHDPNKGNLLAFGIITDELAKRQVGVAAFPTGLTGSDLRIVQVQKQKRGWHDIECAYLQVPTIYGESATWEGPGVTIQSVVFATPLEGSESLLAVRLITETLIFRPVLRKARLPGGSRMDMNLLHSLGLDQTQNSPPADVEFNLWYPRQFALLNQAGGWTVYELEGKRTERMKQLCTTRANQTQENATQPISNHAWGRIAWLSGPSTVAVCSRTKVTLFDIGQQDPIELQELDVGLDKFGQILDLVAVPSHPNHVIIITSVHMIVYHVETVQNEDIVANMVAEIRHFRNSNEISLRASCFSEESSELACNETLGIQLIKP